MKTPVLIYCIFALAVTAAIIKSENAIADSCPVFTAAMVDAAAMAFGLSPGGYSSIAVGDDPSIPMIYCKIVGSPPAFLFNVEVNYSSLNYAIAYGQGANEDDPDYDARLFSVAEQLSPAQMKACRKVILKSFVWKNYCAPALP